MMPVSFIIFTHMTMILVLGNEEIKEDFDYHQKYIFHKDRKEENRRVLGGSRVPATELSFAVGLLNVEKTTICSGSIIAPTFVLTAAHCIDMHYVHKAEKDNNDWELKVYEAKDYVTHPDFHFTTGDTGIESIRNDIALLQTKESMVQGWVQPIRLSKVSLQKAQGSLGTVAGYGKRGMFAGPSLRNLHHAELQLSACPASWTIMICGSTPDDIATTRAVCGGDSGGPMIHEGKLLGINSIGPALCTKYLSKYVRSAFTLVSAYIPWIRSEMRKRGSRLSLDSVVQFTTAQTLIFGARVTEGIKKKRESDNLKDYKLDEKIIYQDVYYSNRKTNLCASVDMFYFILFTMLVF